MLACIHLISCFESFQNLFDLKHNAMQVDISVEEAPPSFYSQL